MPKPGTTTKRGYGWRYQQARARILGPAGKGTLPHDPPCHWGCGRIATTADHDPPLEQTGRPHLNLVPACAPCNYGRNGTVPATSTPAPPSRDWW